jgi:hypothetical protein
MSSKTNPMLELRGHAQPKALHDRTNLSGSARPSIPAVGVEVSGARLLTDADAKAPRPALHITYFDAAAAINTVLVAHHNAPME